jgi:hypothetical protein
MPNNSSARRKKGRKKSEKKKTVPPPLHKKDKASLDSVPNPLSLSGQEECVMDTSSSSLSLAGMDDEKELHVSGPAQKALLKEFRFSLTQAQSGEMYGKLREDYPDANAEELARNLRAVMVTAALEARRRKIQDEKDPSFPPPYLQERSSQPHPYHFKHS